MVSGTRDTLPPETTLPCIYMINSERHNAGNILKLFPALSLLETFSNSNTLTLFTQYTMLNYSVPGPWFGTVPAIGLKFVCVCCVCVCVSVYLSVCVCLSTRLSFFLCLYTSFISFFPLIHSFIVILVTYILFFLIICNFAGRCLARVV